MFSKNRCSKYFASFTGKHLCWSLFSINFQAFRKAKIYLLKRIFLKRQFFGKLAFKNQLRTRGVHERCIQRQVIYISQFFVFPTYMGRACRTFFIVFLKKFEQQIFCSAGSISERNKSTWVES